MPTRRLPDSPDVPFCNNPEHRPPSHMVWPPGRYEHICPSCGFRTVFTVPNVTLLPKRTYLPVPWQQRPRFMGGK